jgi:hypothetical protein
VTAKSKQGKTGSFIDDLECGQRPSKALHFLLIRQIIPAKGAFSLAQLAGSSGL